MNSATESVELEVRLGSRQLRVVRHGNESTHVVFEAGGGCGADVWAAVQDQLPDSVTSWSYDRAGEGRSPSNGDWSLDASVQDLQSLLGAVDISEPLVLVAHSLGSHIVRTFVARNPHVASAMLLIDPRPPHFETAVRSAGIPIFTPPPEASIVREITAADDVVARLAVPGGVRAVAICSDRFDAAPGELTDAEADRVAQMWRDAQSGIARSIGQAELRVVPGTGHAIPLEAPAHVAAVIAELLERVR